MHSVIYPRWFKSDPKMSGEDAWLYDTDLYLPYAISLRREGNGWTATLHPIRGRDAESISTDQPMTLEEAQAWAIALWRMT